jgi:hypothetical protein
MMFSKELSVRRNNLNKLNNLNNLNDMFSKLEWMLIS